MREPLLPPDIIGHSAQRIFLRDLIRAKRLPATVMLSGASGIGKKLIAREVARTLFCETSQTLERMIYGGCGSCKACHLFDSGNYPDFHFVQCLDREQAKVEGLRELLYSLNLNPFAGVSRVVIFDNAEHLSTQSANLLLKSFEEPRPGTYFLLMCASQSKLPATLLSRCQIWYFDALSREEIATILSVQATQSVSPQLTPERLTELALLADGSLENVEGVAAHFEEWRETRRHLDQIVTGDMACAYQLSTRVGKEKEQIRIYLQLMRIYARDRMQQECEKTLRTRWALFLTNIISAERLILERNLAAPAVLLVCFTALGPVAQFTTLPNSATLLERIAL